MRTVELTYKDLGRWKWNSDKTAKVSVDGKDLGSFYGHRPKQLLGIVKNSLGVKRVKSSVKEICR